MAGDAVSIDINAPAATVWRIMSDVERWHEWTPSITSVQRLDSGEFKVGSSARVRQPRLAPMVWTVTKIEAGHGFTWVAGALGVTSYGEHWLSTDGESVRVTLGIRQTGLLAPIVWLLTAGLTRRYLDMEARGLKAHAEAAATKPAAAHP